MSSEKFKNIPWQKKLSLQWRLTLMSGILLALSCLLVYILISNSALMRMDEIETTMMSIELESEGEVYNINLGDLNADLVAEVQAAKRNFRIFTLVITILIILGGSGLTWFLSGLVLKPLRTFTQEIAGVSEQTLSAALPVPETGDEIADLTVSFNRMLKRLDNAFTAQKQFTANAAHELRTPLAVMLANLEVFRKKKEHTTDEYEAVIQKTMGQTERLSALVNSLLELLSLHTVPVEDDVELYGLCEEILCDLADPAAKKEIKLSQSGLTSHVKGNDALLYRAIYNLVENAIKYNHPGGSVHVEIGEGTVTVSDTGAGIDPEQWDKIFEPFYRVDKARSRSMGGAGLGLALVSDIARVHGGDVKVLESSQQGTAIRIQM